MYAVQMIVLAQELVLPSQTPYNIRSPHISPLGRPLTYFLRHFMFLAKTVGQKKEGKTENKGNTGCLKKVSFGKSGTSKEGSRLKSVRSAQKIIYPTCVKENCKFFSDQNTVLNMAKIQFEKYKKIEKNPKI